MSNHQLKSCELFLCRDISQVCRTSKKSLPKIMNMISTDNHHELVLVFMPYYYWFEKKIFIVYVYNITGETEISWLGIIIHNKKVHNNIIMNCNAMICIHSNITTHCEVVLSPWMSLATSLPIMMSQWESLAMSLPNVILLWVIKHNSSMHWDNLHK